MSITSILEQAKACLQARAHEHAVTVANYALSIEPNNADAMAVKIIALRRDKKYEESLAATQAALAVYPQEMRFHQNRAECYFDQGDLEAAKKYILEGLKIDPRAIELKFLLHRITLLQNPPQSPLRHKKISIVAPSRLQRSQYHEGNPYWIELAYKVVQRQTIIDQLDWEIVIGLDHGTEIPDVLAALPRLRFAFAAPDAPRNQPTALNVAVKEAKHDVLAFFEEDDIWVDNFLEVTLSYIDPFDFVSTSQREEFPDGKLHEYLDFGTPNAWVMTRACWDKVGGMDERFVHLDLDFLGRLNKTDCRRVFLYYGEASENIFDWVDARYNLILINTLSPPGSMLVSGGDQPLVRRLRHDSSVTGGIRTNVAQSARSAADYKLLHELYGEILPY